MTSPITWEYLPLLDIEVTPGVARDQARLLCEEDEGGWMSSAICDDTYLFYLEPYAALLSDWLQDKSAMERPVVPVYRSEGRLYFCLTGAEHDYPELRYERTHRFFSNTYKTHGQTARAITAPAALNRFHKSLSRKG